MSKSPKSILTSAMENVAAKKAAKEADESATNPEILAAKRAIRRANRILIAASAATIVAYVAITRSTKDETPEDEEI